MADVDPVQPTMPEVAAPLLSVIVKTLNEQDKIGACLASIIEATRQYTTQIIVADSRSDDATVQIARDFGVNVVRLAPSEARGCGVGTQLGFQHSTGRYILLMDGDMRLDPAFLPQALQALEEDSGLAGVGGIVNFDDANLEYRLRRERDMPHLRPGSVEQLDGGGLYRRRAIEEVGYLANRNLHSYEELDLGLRLTEAGWRLRRIGVPAVDHRGHTVPALGLLWRRWRNRYIDGQGEVLRAALGTKLTGRLLCRFWLSFVVIGWWACLAASLLIDLVFGLSLLPPFALLLFPLCVMTVKRRSLLKGVYSVVLWQVIAAGLIRGLLRPQIDPTAPIVAEMAGIAEVFPVTASGLRNGMSGAVGVASAHQALDRAGAGGDSGE